MSRGHDTVIVFFSGVMVSEFSFAAALPSALLLLVPEQAASVMEIKSSMSSSVWVFDVNIGVVLLSDPAIFIEIDNYYQYTIADYNIQGHTVNNKNVLDSIEYIDMYQEKKHEN